MKAGLNQIPKQVIQIQLKAVLQPPRQQQLRINKQQMIRRLHRNN